MRSGVPTCFLAAIVSAAPAWGDAPPALTLDPAENAALSAINCTIKPLHVVEVSSPVRGIAAKVFVRPGSHVNEGEPLVQLDTEMAAADARLAAARADADAALKAAIINRDGLARKEARMAKAMDEKAVSIADHEAAVLELSLAGNAVLREEQQMNLARLDRAKADMLIDKSTIRSPVSGRVGEDVIDPGEAVGDGHVATIYVNQPLRVEAFVPAPVLHDFLARRSIAARIGEADATALPLTLDYVSPVADLASNTVSVFFTLDQASVLPGSKCLIPGRDSGSPAGASSPTDIVGQVAKRPLPDAASDRP